MTTTDHLKVLFVEDSPDDVELTLHALQREGFHVEWDRVEAEDDLRIALNTKPPQIILSDFTMPVFSGGKAMSIVKELAPNLPFIFVSGTIGEERAIEAMRMGATDYVLKGNLRRLGPAVRRALKEAVERERTQAMEESRSRLAAILEATSDFVAIYGPDGKIVYLNAAGRTLTGAGDVDLTGSDMSEFHPAWANDVIHGQALKSALRDGHWHGETALLARDGSEIPVSQVVIVHRGPGGEMRYSSAIARDIRERRKYEARIQHLANFDALTDLPNRTLLGDRAAQGITHSRRTGRSLALMVVDLDRFKLVNDGFGHAAGDALLRQVGTRIGSVVRDGDTVARLGADAFAILAVDLARADDVLGIARKIQDIMRAPFELEGRELHATVSIGASTYPRDGEDFEALLRNADAAMHRVKAQGENGFQFYAAEMTSTATDRMEIESSLRAAISKGELELHYQPQIFLDTGVISGVEALMRWKHAERGWLPPNVFIPIAEDTDLIHPLGDWALLSAFRQLGEWDKAHPGKLRVSVNVSAKQFHSTGFIDVVARVLRASEMNPERLELELTESVLVENQEEAIRILEQLKALGVTIAVDDFGTGYSSLSYLSRLPVDCLKIDRAFVQRMLDDRHDTAIVQAVLSLARALGLRVIAEGVETIEQCNFLRNNHCDEAQGYLFSKPLSCAAVAPLLDLGTLSMEPTHRTNSHH